MCSFKLPYRLPVCACFLHLSAQNGAFNVKVHYFMCLTAYRFGVKCAKVHIIVQLCTFSAIPVRG